MAIHSRALPNCQLLLLPCSVLPAKVTSRWPAELESKQRRLAAVQDTLNNSINTEVTTAHARVHYDSMAACEPVDCMRVFCMSVSTDITLAAPHSCTGNSCLMLFYVHAAGPLSCRLTCSGCCPRRQH
jgi:hypothetical protein